MQSGTAVYLGTSDVTAHSIACCADSAMMFPLGYSEGISISVDLTQLSSIYPEVLKNAGVEANQLRNRFCSGKPSAIPSCSDLEHIFAPLFSAPVSVRISPLKLKVLEILIYLSNMKPLWIKLRKLKRLWVLSTPMNHAIIDGYLNTVRTGTAMC